MKKEDGINERFNNIINKAYDMYKNQLLDSNADIASDLIITTLKSIKENKHDILKPRDFSKNFVPSSNLTYYDKKSKKYVVTLLSKNNSNLLDAISNTNNYNNKHYIPLDNLKKMKLYKFISNINMEKTDIIVHSNTNNDNLYNKNEVQNKIANNNSKVLTVVNIESLKFNPVKNKKGLKDNVFNQIFINYNLYNRKIRNVFKEYARNFNNNFKKPPENEETHNKIIEAKTYTDDFINNKTGLKLFTLSMYDYELAKITNNNYEPKYTDVQLKNEMIRDFEYNPNVFHKNLKDCGRCIDQVVNNYFVVNENNKTNTAEKQNILAASGIKL